MNTKVKWTPLLVAEARNRDIVPFKKMSAQVRWLMSVAFLHLEVYTTVGWIAAERTGMTYCDPTRAYRIYPSYDPLVKAEVRP